MGFGIALALLSALIYTGASLFLKSAIERGATAGQVNLAANLALALLVQPLWLFDRPEVPNAALWQPILCCVLFFVGQIFTFAALSRGDVSVATPLLGTKIIMVTAINAIVFGLPVTMRWWVAAVIASLSVMLVAGSAPRGKSRAVIATAIYSLLAALFYSMTDVLIQHWGGTFDELAFLPLMFGAIGILAVVYYLVMDRGAFRPRRSVVAPLVSGGVLFGTQVSCVFFSLVWTRDATLVNVLYTTRSVWAVAVAWLAGRYLGLRDFEAGPKIMTRRLIGSILLFAAILIILL